MSKRATYAEASVQNVSDLISALPYPQIRLGVGYEPWQRVGAKIAPTHIRIRADLVYQYQYRQGVVSVEGELGGKLTRVCVVWDRFPNESTPDFSEVFNSRRTNGNIESNFFSPLTQETGQYQLLYDKIIAWNSKYQNCFFWPASIGAETVSPPGHPCLTYYHKALELDIDLTGRVTRFKQPFSSFDTDTIEGQAWFFILNNTDNLSTWQKLTMHNYMTTLEYNDV